jgi:hypothetical protein
MPLILLRTSERTQFKRCRFAWDLAYNRKVKPKTPSPPLRFGSLIHKALELRYPPGIKRGPHPATTFEKLYEEDLRANRKMGFRDEDGTWHDMAELGIAMMHNFVNTYGKDEEYKVLASECSFQVPILNRRGYQLVYVGVLDGVWQRRDNKHIYINDWKTAKSISTNHLPLDEQVGSYWAYAPAYLKAQKILKTAELKALRGILFTFMRKALPDKRERNADGHCLNKDGTVSKQQPPPYFERVPTYRSERDAAVLRQRVIQEAREMEMVRQGKLPVYKNPGQMNCAGCGFRDVCELHEIGADWEAMLQATMQPWNPYGEHELYLSEQR